MIKSSWEYDLEAMAKRGNPNWGRPHPLPVLVTGFDHEVKRLGLAKSQYIASAELKLWCRENRNRLYVPEWLLEEWKFTVDDSLSYVAETR